MIFAPTLENAPLEVDGCVVRLAFNRDGARNALTRPARVPEEALAAFFEERPGVCGRR